jgi:hypothetical protein
MCAAPAAIMVPSQELREKALTGKWHRGDFRIALALHFTSAVLTCLAVPAALAAGNSASPAQLRAAHETAARFEDLAGSSRNAWGLVQGLRWSMTVTLVSRASPQPVSFTPPTPPMGYGNVARALAVARQELISRGVAKPRLEQLHAVLMGGLLRTGSGRSARIVKTPGVLPLRSVHMSWGQIAHALAISPATHPVAAVRHVATAIRL